MMAKVHIGKKIKEVWKKSRLKGTEFAVLINKDRQVIYDIFKRETIDTGLLQTISKVLDYDFFNDLSQNQPHIAKDHNTKPEYGYVTKSELAETNLDVAKLNSSIQTLISEFEKLRSDLTKKKPVKPKSKPKRKIK